MASSDVLRPETGVRAGLLRTGLFTPTEVSALLDEIGVEGTQLWGELEGEARGRVLEVLEERAEPRDLNGRSDVGVRRATPWGPYLERVRAMLFRYALVHQPLLWERDRPGESVMAAVRRFLGGEVASSAPDVAALDARLAERPEPGDDPVSVRWMELTFLFRLTPLEEDALWLFMAPALLPELQWVVDALLRRGADGMLPMGFVQRVLEGAWPGVEVPDIAGALVEWGTLRHFQLIRGATGAGMYRADERIIEWLQSPGAAEVPRWLGPLIRLDTAVSPFEARQALKWMDADLPRQMKEWVKARRTRIFVAGPALVGARTLARVMAGGQGMQVASVDLGLMAEYEDDAWRAVLREAQLQRAVLLMVNVRALANATPATVGRLLGLLRRDRTPMVFEGGAELGTGVLLDVVDALDLAVVSLSIPEVDAREAMWLAALADQGAAPALARVARSFPFGIDQIEDALRLARLQSAAGGSGVGAALEERALSRACQTLVTHRLGELAQRVEIKHTWDELVLSEELREQVQTLLNFGLLASKVLEEWGYGKRLSYGRGLSALFSGPSGTGKTMIAGLIAHELGMDLYRIDLSRIVSKYIGETEQRLDALFEEARRARCALLFDEADSLFGKRTEVKSSTDRYANLEVNYLLQKLEEHPGVVLLTSNFPKSIDDAFMRRLRFRIHFPRPDEALRQQLWERMIPPEAPQTRNLRLADISKRYELSGGEIRNAVLRAALFAAAENRPLSAADLERSARAEYRQLGRLLKD